jgi:hypothetical protein
VLIVTTTVVGISRLAGDEDETRQVVGTARPDFAMHTLGFPPLQIRRKGGDNRRFHSPTPVAERLPVEVHGIRRMSALHQYLFGPLHHPALSVDDPLATRNITYIQ